VLQFSGGKDSLACLYLLKEYWKELTVMWAYTHDSFPETIAQMREVAGLVGRFEVVHSNVIEQNGRYGPPTDLLPVWDTEVGRGFDETRTRKYQAPFACCSDNLWQPLLDAVKGLGATLVIRGQRTSDKHKSTIRSGHIEAGIEYWFPLEGWSEKQVLSFLTEEGVALPEHYRYFNSSLDCAGCTAYLAEHKGKLAWMQKRHPELAARLWKRLEYVKSGVDAELQHLQEELEVGRAA